MLSHIGIYTPNQNPYHVYIPMEYTKKYPNVIKKNIFFTHENSVLSFTVA